MLRILVVDDEFIEREGIKLLIRKYKLPLTVLEAENGEEALEVLASHSQSQPIDILLTDIKMPFMDGMELSRLARERYPDLKILILSAYGEFHYAQKAIHYGVTSYLLKPIDVNDFVREFTKLIEQCQELQEQEREGLLLQLIQSGGFKGPRRTDKAASRALYGHKPVRMILANTDRHLFDEHYDELSTLVQESFRSLPLSVDPLILNERQCVLFLSSSGPSAFPKETELEPHLNRLRHKMAELSGGGAVTLVVGRPAVQAELGEEFVRMESRLEYTFFYPEGTVLFLDEAHHSEQLSDKIPKLVETIYRHLEGKDDFGFRRGVELFFRTVEDGGRHSAVYIKYTCAELARRILEFSGQWDKAAWQERVEGFFACRSLSELKQHLERVMDHAGKPAEQQQSPEYTKKVIKDVLKLIEEHYQEDISLQWLAEQVYLTQTYLSYLFSKEVGQTLVKYMTQFRMHKAEELLRSGNRTVSEICELVGYRNDSYFIKTFKAYYGVSPAKFRETVH